MPFKDNLNFFTNTGIIGIVSCKSRSNTKTVLTAEDSQ